MTPNLASRLQDIPGIASVTVDLTDSGGGINIRLEAGADEAVVMERLRALLVAYGVRSPNPPLSTKLYRVMLLRKRTTASHLAAQTTTAFGLFPRTLGGQGSFHSPQGTPLPIAGHLGTANRSWPANAA